MKFICITILLSIVIQLQLIYSAAHDKREIKIDNRIICMKGKKGAKLSDIEYVGIKRTSIDLQTFFKQFRPAHVIPTELNNKKTWVSPKFIRGTLSSITKRECGSFDKEKKLAPDEVYGMIFPNGKQLMTLFHDNDMKWSGSRGQLKYSWESLSNFENSE